MTELTAHTAALSQFTRTQHTLADEVATHAARQRTPISGLTLTFGVIGAEFLAAMGFTLDQRATNLDAIGARHRSLGDSVDDAARAYTGQDSANAAVFAGDQELRL